MDLDIYLHAAKEGESGKKFALFYQLLLAYNEKFNLTRIVSEEDCLIKHFADSLAGEKYFQKGARVIEVGSGGGFPSVPLMIYRQDLNFVLLEASEKKCGFLEKAVGELGLPAKVVHGRAEELGRREDFREKFDACTARAVAKLNTLAEYCIPFVKKGGRFIAYKGRAEEEITAAGRAFAELGARLEKADTFELTDGSARTLVVAEKTGNTPAKYPRGRGKERSSPL